MATTESYTNLTKVERHNRYFSEEIKRQTIRDLDRNITTIAEICRELQVSRTTVYKWRYQYSAMKKKGKKMVIESESETRKNLELQKKIKELEQMLGQKQVEIEYLNKIIELTEKDLDIKIKKKDDQ
jgi:transposase-like protein